MQIYTYIDGCLISLLLTHSIYFQLSLYKKKNKENILFWIFIVKFVLGKVTCPRQNSIFTQWSRYACHLLLKVSAADSIFTVGHSALGVLCLFISLQKECIYYSWTKTLVSRAFVLLCCHLELSYFSLVWLKRSSYSNSKGSLDCRVCKNNWR